jgi:ZIP family zinc transporter
MDEAYRRGGFGATALGFLGGSVVYTVANKLLAMRGAKHRKRSGDEHPSTEDASGVAIAVGALLDGIPESIVLGLTLLGGGGVGVPVLAAIFISNLPEGLSSAAGMKNAGRGARYVFGVWGGIALVSGAAGLLGALTLEGASPQVVAVITAIAAGAILAMVADTMLPEAFERTHLYAGLIAAVGFILAFAIERF